MKSIAARIERKRMMSRMMRNNVIFCLKAFVATEKNPLFAFKCYEASRTAGLPMPRLIEKYLDEAAKNLFSPECKDFKNPGDAQKHVLKALKLNDAKLKYNEYEKYLRESSIGTWIKIKMKTSPDKEYPVYEDAVKKYGIGITKIRKIYRQHRYLIKE